jgi:hypothetical protein
MLLVFFQLEIGSAFGWLITQPFLLNLFFVNHDNFLRYLYFYVASIGVLQSALMAFIYYFWPQTLPTLDHGYKILNNGMIVSSASSAAISNAIDPPNDKPEPTSRDKQENIALDSFAPNGLAAAKASSSATCRSSSFTSRSTLSERHILDQTEQNQSIAASVYILYTLLLLALVLIPAITVHHTQRHVIAFHFKRLVTTRLEHLHELQVQVLFLLLLPVARLTAFAVGLLQGNRRWRFAIAFNYALLLLASCLLHVHCLMWSLELQLFALVLLVFGHAALFPHVLHTLQRNLRAPLPAWEVHAFSTILACGNMLAYFWRTPSALSELQLANVHLLLSAFSMLFMFSFRLCTVNRKRRESRPFKPPINGKPTKKCDKFVA